jgi:hypothetical protein
MFVLSFIVPIFSFLLQVWPRLINRYFGIDTWRHLLLADYVRKYHRIPEVLEKQYIHASGNPGYPPVIYLILSIFPKKFAEKYQFIFAPIFDALQNLCIFWFAYLATKDVTTAITAQIIAALTPVAVIEASNLSTRTLSYLVFSLSFIPLVLFTLTNSIIWIVPAFIMLVIMMFTHKFGLQAYLFTTIGMSIALKDPFYILFFLSSFIIVYLFLGKVYRPIFHEHKSILTFWIKNIDNRFIHQFRGHQKSTQVSDFVQKIYLLAFKNPFIYLIGNNPWIIIFVSIFVFSFLQPNAIKSTIINPLLFNDLLAWALVLIAFGGIILLIKQLRFLGEGNRYLEYCIVPLSIIIASYIPSLIHMYGLTFEITAVLLLLIFLVGNIYIQIKVILKDRMRSITPELWDCISVINKYGKGARVAMFPLQFGDALTYFTNGKVLTTYNNEGLAFIEDIYPIVKKPMKDIIKKFNINFILFHENYVTLKELKLTKYKIAVNKNGFILLQV